MEDLLRSSRLRLRQLTVADAPFIVDLMNEPPYHESIGDRGVRTIADGERYITEKYLSSYARHGYGMLLVELRDADAPIGICGLVKRDALNWPDVGFAIRQSHWSQGYASEAAGATLEYARNSLALRQVYGVVKPTNHKSIRILEGIGLRYLGPFESPGISPGASLYGTELANGSND